MSNHFHILVEVPERPEVPLEEAAMLAHVEVSLGKRKAQDYGGAATAGRWWGAGSL